MKIRIGRTVPPAAAPLHLKDIFSGVAGIFSGRKTVGRFENEVKRAYCVRHCFAVSSGKAALVLILQALQELTPEKDEVLIPAYTCYSVPSAIVRAGLRVRLCDISSGTLDFDFNRLAEQLDNPRLLCVIPTHLFGLPADVERLKSLLCSRRIFVLEDAAQAMGGESNGRKIGTLGDVGLFSLGRGKAFSTVEGGLILTDNESIGLAIERRLAAIPEYGALDCLKLMIYAVALSALIHPWVYWFPKLLPFLKLGETRFDPSFPIRRLSPFQAGMAKGWRTKTEEFMGIRSRNANNLAACGITLAGALQGAIPELIKFPFMTVDAEAKKMILHKSERMGLGISDGYPDSIDGINGLACLSDSKEFPGARELAVRLVSLPVHPLINENDTRKIANLLAHSGK